jgi:hypothetical protein
MFHGINDYITQVAGATLTGAAVIRNDVSDVSICWDGGRYVMAQFIENFLAISVSSYSDITPKKLRLQVIVT